MRQYSILICAIFFSIMSFAQTGKVKPVSQGTEFYFSAQQAVSKPTGRKLGGLMLHQKLKDPAFAQSNELQNIMVKGDPGAVRGLTERYHGYYKFAAGRISSVAIPASALLAFADESAVEDIEAYTGFTHGKSFMDTARILNNIDSAQQGAAPLTQAYKGAGVLVGVIDGGIYFRHKDFKRANGTTRIRYIWDQANTTGTAPTPFGYGSTWDSSAINNNTCGHVEPSSDQGHGTAAAGVVAGNGSSWDTGDAYLRGRYTGAAPEADMVIVRVDGTRPDYLQTIADAINYIYTKADELGMPCVINTSVGTYYGPHDGSELSVQAIESMLTQKNGRSLVAAAGNGANVKHHLSYQLNPTDSLYTWFSYNTTTHDVYFDLWADTAQFRGANFAVGCDLSTTGAVRGRGRYYNIPNDFPFGSGSYYEIYDSVMSGTTRVGVYYLGVTKYQGLYHLEVQILPASTADLWRFQTKGTGTFDMWASKTLIGTANFAPVANPLMWPNAKVPDSSMTIVSGWQCSDKVITVANYYNRKGYRDIDSNYVNLAVQPGALSITSSLGPTRDGRVKPDIGATGDVITTTGDSTYISLLSSSGAANRQKVSLGGKHVRDGGTSMASPIVAGAAALYLQKNPNASAAEVKSVLERTAKRDTFTSTVNIPNMRFGYGKLNAFQALKYTVIYGCMDTASGNYNPNANIDTGACVPKIYGCTDTGSINYNPLANTNNGTCIPKVYGCTDTGSINYSASANVNNGTCIAKVYGCTDTGSVNYSASANVDNGTCIAKIYGCTDTASINYNASANVNNGTCILKVYGCTDTASINYNVSANVNNGTCILKVYGCTDTGSVNYNASANVDNGTCVAKVYGCTDTSSINYNASANVNNGTCVAKIYGCTDTGSINYNASANVSNGNCIAKVYGCTDTGSVNYNASANVNNGTCVAKVYGCTDTASINYSASANTSNGSCIPKVYGCTDTGSINYSAQANVNNGSCIAKVYGITDTTCTNYNALANVNRGTCIGVGVKDISADDLVLDAVPNPFGNVTTIFVYTTQSLEAAEIRIYDMLGKTADVIALPAGTHQIVYNNSKLAAGVYDLALVRNNSIIAIKKVVVGQ